MYQASHGAKVMKFSSVSQIYIAEQTECELYFFGKIVCKSRLLLLFDRSGIWILLNSTLSGTLCFILNIYL